MRGSEPSLKRLPEDLVAKCVNGLVAGAFAVPIIEPCVLGFGVVDVSPADSALRGALPLRRGSRFDDEVVAHPCGTEGRQSREILEDGRMNSSAKSFRETLRPPASEETESSSMRRLS